jgi:hypothetical protein
MASIGSYQFGLTRFKQQKYIYSKLKMLKPRLVPECKHQNSLLFYQAKRIRSPVGIAL